LAAKGARVITGRLGERAAHLNQNEARTRPKLKKNSRFTGDNYPPRKKWGRLPVIGGEESDPMGLSVRPEDPDHAITFP
jgi:hypothetical protein